MECPQCHNTYSSAMSLRKHINEVHRSVDFYCGHCGRPFGSQWGLRRHLLSRHGPVFPGVPTSAAIYSGQGRGRGRGRGRDLYIPIPSSSEIVSSLSENFHPLLEVVPSASVVTPSSVTSVGSLSGSVEVCEGDQKTLLGVPSVLELGQPQTLNDYLNDVIGEISSSDTDPSVTPPGGETPAGIPEPETQSVSTQTVEADFLDGYVVCQYCGALCSSPLELLRHLSLAHLP